MEDRYKSAGEMKRDLLKIEAETNSSLGDIAGIDTISEQGSIIENNLTTNALREPTAVNHAQVGDDLKIERSTDSSRIPTQRDATNTKLKKDKKIALYLAPVFCLAALIGIWMLYSGMLKKTGEVPDPSVVVAETETAQKSVTNSGEDVMEETEEVTDEEVIEAWNDIYSTLKEMAVEGDVQGIMDLANVSEEDAKYLAQDLKDESYNNYDSQNTYIMWTNKKYYYVETTEYLVTGVHPNTHMSNANHNAILEKKDGEWRIINPDEMTEEELTEINESIYGTIFGTGLFDALRAGRNCGDFSNHMFTHPELVFNGCLDTSVISSWQNEDGSMDIQFCGTNGTSNTITYKSVNITLTDETLGTICDISPVEYWDSITPGRSKVFTVHVDPSNVLTGTTVWGSVHSHVHTNY